MYWRTRSLAPQNINLLFVCRLSGVSRHIYPTMHHQATNPLSLGMMGCRKRRRRRRWPQPGRQVPVRWCGRRKPVCCVEGMLLDPGSPRRHRGHIQGTTVGPRTPWRVSQPLVCGRVVLGWLEIVEEWRGYGGGEGWWGDWGGRILFQVCLLRVRAREDHLTKDSRTTRPRQATSEPLRTWRKALIRLGFAVAFLCLVEPHCFFDSRGCLVVRRHFSDIHYRTCLSKSSLDASGGRKRWAPRPGFLGISPHMNFWRLRSPGAGLSAGGLQVRRTVGTALLRVRCVLEVVMEFPLCLSGDFSGLWRWVETLLFPSVPASLQCHPIPPSHGERPHSPQVGAQKKKRLKTITHNKQARVYS